MTMARLEVRNTGAVNIQTEYLEVVLADLVTGSCVCWRLFIFGVPIHCNFQNFILRKPIPGRFAFGRCCHFQ